MDTHKNKECDQNKAPESREERIRKYLIEKERYVPWRKIHKFFPLSKRLDDRADERFWKKLTPEQKEYIRYNGRVEYISMPQQKSDNFSPTAKIKDHTIIGPLDGKGSWKADYSPSVINTTAGKFCPGAVADKDQITKEKVTKDQKYEDKVRREKYTHGPSIDLKYNPRVERNYIFMYKPLIFGKKVKTTEKEKTFEEELCDTIRALDIKKSDSTAILTALQAALCRRLTSDIVKNNYTIITEVVKKTITKGRKTEQIAAAKIIPILFIQLGEDQCEEFLISVRTPLVDNIMDETINTNVRAECCETLAFISFLSNSASCDIIQLMKIYGDIFFGNHQEDDNSVKAENMLHVTALDAWSLLLTKCSPAEVNALLGRTSNTSSLSLSDLAQLLLAPSAELQKSAGIALSLAYEIGLKFSEKFGQDNLSTITMDVKQLAKDPGRYKTKENRKSQRAIFRDVLNFLEEGVTPVKSVCVGDDRIQLDQWTLHVRYQRLAARLGSGLQISFVTSLLQSAMLMTPVRNGNTKYKGQKEKDNQNTSNDKSRNVSKVKKPRPSASEIKARDILRTKSRNKELAVMYY